MIKAAYSPDEIAEIMPITANTIRAMVRDGRLKRIPNTGRNVCVAFTELERVWGEEFILSLSRVSLGAVS